MVMGTIRKIDPLGRVTLPIEFRACLKLKSHDRVQIILDDNQIIIKPVTEDGDSDS